MPAAVGRLAFESQFGGESMIGIGSVILGAIAVLVLARDARSQEPPPVVVEVRNDAAHREEALRHRRVIRGK